MGREDEYKRVKVKLRDAAGPRSAYWGIKKGATDALGNYLFSMTLGLHFPPDTGTRSAVYVVIDGRHFVISASHLLKRDSIKEIWAVPRPQSPLTQVPNPRTNAVPTLKPGRQFQLPVEGLRFEPDPLDLLVIRVKPLPDQSGYLRAYDVADRNPSPVKREQVMKIIGFPEDYYLQTGKDNGNGAGLQRRLSMFLHATERAKEQGSILGYNRKLHLLLNLNSTRFGAMKVDPVGMSGGSVWRMRNVVSTRELWTPGLADLVGIQTGCYKSANLIKATRIEEAVRIARSIP